MGTAHGHTLASFEGTYDSPYRTATADELRAAAWPSNNMATTDNVKDAVAQARQAVRRAAALEDNVDPIPIVERGRGRTTWRLDLA